MSDHETELYRKTVERLHRIGKDTTGVGCIVALAGEIEGYRQTMRGMEAYIEELVRRPAMCAAPLEWHKAGEQLPTSSCACLAVAGGEIVKASYNPVEGFWRTVPYGYIYGPGYVTHWADMPELPKEE